MLEHCSTVTANGTPQPLAHHVAGGIGTQRMTYGANASGARCRQALGDTPGDPAKSVAAFTKLYNQETQPKPGLARVAGDGNAAIKGVCNDRRHPYL
jgi:hypothetical protein